MQYKDLRIGMTAEFRKKFSQENVNVFADLVNDHNPVHLDHEFASRSVFKKRIVHGLLVSGLISGLLGTNLPGKGCIYLGQTLNFIKPVFIEDEITAKVEIINLRDEKKIVTLRTICLNQNNEEVVTGEAIIKSYD